MDLHPNWKALCTVDFYRKQFVRQNSDNTSDKRKEPDRYPFSTSLDGNATKEFYVGVISSTGSSDRSPVKPVKNLPKKIIKTEKDPPVTKLPFTRRLQSKFLTAAEHDKVEEVRDLLSRCPDLLNTCDDFGWTALMCASKANSYETVEELLKAGADVSVEDRKGNSAEDLTSSKEISFLLQNFKSILSSRKCTCDDRLPEVAHSNPDSSERRVCSACGEFYDTDREREHKGSTLHVFSSNLGHKMPTHYGIPQSNRGFQLLLKNGWDKEKGLGPEGSGHKFPPKTILKRDKLGLGKKTTVAKVTHFHAGDIRAIENRNKTSKTINNTQRLKYIGKEKSFERNFRLQFW